MLSTSQRKALKAWVFAARRAYVRAFRSFTRDDLLQALRAMGLREGDALMLHSGFSQFNGFAGTIDDLTDVFLQAVGPQGHLLMVSLPYRDSTYGYLQRARKFDVRHTPSMMGMVSEMFRRRPGVLRSAHPTHPVAVAGPRAAWFVQDHPGSVHPCGPGSPFERLAQADGKIGFFDVTFDTFTFFHYLEHLVHESLPFRLYTQQVFEVPVIDALGQTSRVRTHAYDPPAIARRRFDLFEAELRSRGAIATRRIGNASMEIVRAADSIACTLDMARAGRYFYDLSPDAGPAASPPG